MAKSGNPNHDEHGLFASAPGNGASGTPSKGVPDDVAHTFSQVDRSSRYGMNDAMDSYSKTQYESFTPVQKEAVNFYQASGFRKLNDLAAGRLVADQSYVQEMHDALNSVVRSEVVPTDLTLLKGTNRTVESLTGFPAANAIGKTFSIPSFASTTYDQNTAEKFASLGERGGTILSFGVKAGTPGMVIRHQSESEVVMPPESRFTVTSITRDAKGIQVIHCEHIAGNGSTATHKSESSKPRAETPVNSRINNDDWLMIHVPDKSKP